MELSAAFGPGVDTVDHIRLAEDLGYSRAWVYDSPALFGDCWMTLAMAAGATRTIGLGTGVLIPSLRHPMVTAAAVAHLAALAPGRVSVGLGTGFTGRFVMGKPPLTWASTERYIDQIARLLRGETVEVDGAACRMIHPAGFVADRPVDYELLVAANGPKGLGAAARLGAEGVITIFGGQAGWDRCTLLMYGTVLDDGESTDSDRVMAAAGPGGAVMFHGMYEADPSLMASLPGGDGWLAAIEAFPESQRHLHTHEQHLVSMTDRDRAAVTGDIISMATWTGTPEELRDRVQSSADSGVSELMYAPMGPDIERELRAFRDVVT